jgi:hypothetical protein
LTDLKGEDMDNMVFYWMSLIIPIVVLIPNLLWLLFPPNNTPLTEKVNEPVSITILENAGRLGVAIIPLFYPIVFDNEMSHLILLFMLLLLAIYYVGWFRFFCGGRNYGLLFLPLWRLPIPMALSPVLYFILSAELLKSIPMFLAALSLAIGHLSNSYTEYRRITHIQ